MRRFALGLNTAKNTAYIEKCFKQRLHRIKFPTKKVGVHISLSPPGVELEGSKELPFLKYYNTKEWEVGSL